MEVKRKYIRFNADPNTFVAVKIGEKDPIGGLAITESRGGCSAVFLATNEFKENNMCYIKVGDMAPAKAEIRWTMNVDKDLVKVGFEFVD